MRKLKTSRQNYNKTFLERVKNCPFEQFEDWLQEAYDEEDIIEPNAMTVCTVDTEGQPSARIILLRNFSQDGFEFFTNYNSQKGSEIEENSKVALCFYWAKLERQIRIEGNAEKLSAKKSDSYFNARPIESRISAIISKQSQVVASREELEKKVQDFRASNQAIVRPKDWGGYIVKPSKIEFWQGRPSRLHDRIRYSLKDDWLIERLYP